jgi:hypothetical protein
MVLIYQYKKGSKSARALAKELGAKRIKLEGSRFRPRRHKTIINWGASAMPAGYDVCRILNRPEQVGLASNKLRTFQAIDQELVPEWTTSQAKAISWALGGDTVAVRHLLQGHSGAGLELISDARAVPQAPLYAKYIRKQEEFRVHVFNNTPIHTQRKARDRGVPDDQVNWQVRNHKNGFIFAVGGVQDFAGLGQLEDAAVRAVQQLGLDFGAVDIIWNGSRDRAYVLEVNTAPGLEGQTLERYSQAIRSVI